METASVIARIREAIEQLTKRDAWLWQNNLSERSLAHRLALYLETLFPDYNVDCEYNGDVSSTDGLKRIWLLSQEMRQMGLLKDFEQDALDEDLIDRLVYPDIIVHQRSTNQHNLCILEIKKSASKIHPHYDRLKLATYTSDVNRNNLHYELGVFILLHMGTPGSYELEFFQDGEVIKIDN